MAKMTLVAGYLQIGLILAESFRSSGFQDRYDELKSALNCHKRSVNYLQSICRSNIDSLLNEPPWNEEADLYPLAQEMKIILSNLEGGQLTSRQIGELFLKRKKKEAYRKVCRDIIYVLSSADGVDDQDLERLREEVAKATDEDSFLALACGGIIILARYRVNWRFYEHLIEDITKARKEERIEDILIAIC